MDPRQVKAEQIVAGGRITRGEGCWLVPSQSGGPRYRVEIDGLFPSCACEDFELSNRDCKHIRAARLWARQEEVRRATGAPRPVPLKSNIPATPKRPTYKQDWPNYNK